MDRIVGVSGGGHISSAFRETGPGLARVLVSDVGNDQPPGGDRPGRGHKGEAVHVAQPFRLA